jgi:pyruvate dehydrogenase E2 component (dihydrolipoyllysine-residue acetyltransferase)
MAEFRMPSLGASMEEGTVVAWRRQPGERIARGEVIAEIETDKGAIEVESFHTGVVDQLLVAAGAKAPVGAPLAVIREEGAVAADAPPAPPAAPPPAAAPPAAVRASPMARKRARELGVALEGLAGSGPHGAITVADVEGAAAQPPAESARDRMRRAIAATVALSKREIPHFYTQQTIDMGPALAWLERENAALPVADRILAGALLVKAVAVAVKQAPEVNGHVVAGVATVAPEVHVANVLFLRGGGLVAPALRDADRTPLRDLMRAFRDLVERARAGRLRSSELTGGTIGITSLGERGAELVLPVIFPPQIAMVGFGAIAERPWCVAGAVVPRPLLQATLAADHRVVDGHGASRFLRALEAAITAPEGLA